MITKQTIKKLEDKLNDKGQWTATDTLTGDDVVMLVNELEANNKIIFDLRFVSTDMDGWYEASVWVNNGRVGGKSIVFDMDAGVDYDNNDLEDIVELINDLDKEAVKVAEEFEGAGKIEVGIYFTEDEDGNKVYDTEAMREEYDDKVNKLIMEV